MTESFSNEFDNYNELRNGMENDHEHHQHEGMHTMHPHQNLIETIQHCEITCEHMTTVLKQKHDLHMRMKGLKIHLKAFHLWHFIRRILIAVII